MFMNKLYVLLFLLTGLSNSILSQTQLSYFDNQVPTAKYPFSGIENINGVDYLIETNDVSLRVSIVNDSIEVLYEVADFSQDSQKSWLYGNMKTRSGYLVDNIFLYEIFRNEIRKRNLLTSEVVEIYSFPNDEIRSLLDVQIIGDILHFETYNGSDFATYKINNQEFEVLPFEKNKTFRTGNTYLAGTGNHGITQYDAETGTSVNLFPDENNFYTGVQSFLNGQKGLVFGALFDTRFVNADTSFLLNCALSNPLVSNVDIHETLDNYVVFYNDDNESTIKIISKIDCSEIASETFPSFQDVENVKIFDIPYLNDEYILFAMNYLSYGPAQLLLFDKKTTDLSVIDQENIQFINENSFYKSGDEIYFIGHDSFESYPDFYLYSLNLKTKKFKNKQEGFTYGKPIKFGTSEIDSTHFLAKNPNGNLDIFRFENGSNADLIFTGSDTRNAGLGSVRYLAIEEEKLVFKFKDGIYLADNFSGNNDKVSLIIEANKVSNLVISNGIAEGLVNNSDTTFHLKYQFDSNILTTDALEEYIEPNTNSIAFANYIFGQFSISDKMFFDLKSSSFKSIPVQGDIISMHKSDQQMLFLSTCTSGYCLTFFKDDSFKELQSIFQNKPEIFSKENGAYIIVENTSTFISQVSIINNEGIQEDQIQINGSRITHNQSGIAKGPLSALMFYNDQTENMEIIMHRYNNIHRYTLPYKHANFAPVVWYKAGNSLIIKSDDYGDDEADIYVCTLGKEIKKLIINEDGNKFRDLLFASHSNGKISFIIDSSHGGIQIVEYDVGAEIINMINSPIDRILYTWYAINPIYRISPTKYYVTYTYQYEYEVYENGEIHVFDANDLTVEQGTDLNQRIQQSNPHRFIESPTHLFFIARSHPDNSYQLYAQEKEEITSTFNIIKNKSELTVHPNPSREYISFDSSADFVHFFDLKGRLVKTLNNYNKNQRMDISNLSRGVYFIESITGSKKTSGRFMKI